MIYFCAFRLFMMFLLLFLIHLAAFNAAVCIIFFFFLFDWSVKCASHLKTYKTEWSIKYGWPQTGRIMCLELFMQLQSPTPNNPLPPFGFCTDFIICSEINNVTVLLLNTNFIQGVVAGIS